MIGAIKQLACQWRTENEMVSIIKSMFDCVDWTMQFKNDKFYFRRNGFTVIETWTDECSVEFKTNNQYVRLPGYKLMDLACYWADTKNAKLEYLQRGIK